MKKITLLIFTMALFSCSSYKPLNTVERVDIGKYMGKWYEIASFPQSFQKGCSCTFAEYALKNEKYVSVSNSCKVDGTMKKAEGKAFVVKGSGNAKLKVQFFWPFKGKYWIIYLEDDYSIAIVGHPNRKYLWILARESQISPEKYSSLLEQLKAMEFDTSKLVKTEHACT